jgi:hypothetical protein
MKKRHFRRLAVVGATGVLSALHHPASCATPGEPESSLLNVPALEEKSAVEARAEAAPVTYGIPAQISADYIEYNQKVGDFSASGRARVLHAGDTLRTEVVLGNVEKGEVAFPETVRVTTQNALLELSEGKYNFNQEIGEFLEGKGQVKKRYFTGDKVTLHPNQIDIQNVKMAKDVSLLEQGKNPAIWVRSPKVVIVPGEKMTVQKPTLYLGPHKLFRVADYKVDLRDGARDSQFPFPKFNYNDDLGPYVTFTQPLNLPDKFFGDVKVGYYHRGDFKYDARIRRSTDIGNFSLSYGQIYNEDGNRWIRRTPELQYRTKDIRFGNSGFYMYGAGLAARWKEESKESARYEGEGWIIRRPISLGPQTKLSFGGGVRYVYEEKFENDFSQLRGYALLEHQFSPKLYGSLSVEGNSRNKAVFKYRSTDTENAIRPFMTYKLDKRNQFQVGSLYDIDAGQVKEYKAGWFHDLRGFQLELTYTRDKINHTNDISFKIHTRMF